MNNSISRRSMLALSAALVAGSRQIAVIAHQATPHSEVHQDAPAREMPEITVVLTDTEVTFPSEIQAGINHVTFENQSAADGHLLTFRVPEDFDMEAFFALLEDEDSPFPEELRNQYFPGMPDYPEVGGNSSGYVKYESGTCVSFNGFGGQIPAVFNVVGDSWGVPPPKADHEIGMVEMTFLGIDKPIDAGGNVWSIVNYGATWHEIMVVGMPQMQTPDELLESFLATESDADLEAAGYSMVGASGIMSPGVQVWLEWDLAPGAYGALCFAPDNFEGPPHALAGMVSTFEVV